MSANPRLFTGDVQGAPNGVVQFTVWDYYVSEDGNFLLSTNPATSESGTVSVDVKTPGGDRIAKVK